MIPLIIDHRLSYLPSNDELQSLLTLPVGMQSFLDYLSTLLEPVRDEELIYVMPDFDYDDAYERRVLSCSSSKIRVVHPLELSLRLGRYEQSDKLLVIDPVQWPTEGFNWDVIAGALENYAGVIHAISIGQEAGRIRERLDCDENGYVMRVERLYDSVSWPAVADTANIYSVGPLRTMVEIPFTSLRQLRFGLSTRGVLAQDHPIASRVIDLSKEEQFLELNDRVLAQSMREDPPPNFARREEHVLIGDGCRIAASAKLIGPVILHPRVILEDDVTIIGRAVVGPGSRIRRGSVVAQSVLTANATIGPDARIRRRVTDVGHGEDPTTSSSPTSPLSEMIGLVDDGFNDDGAEQPVFRIARARRLMHMTLKRAMDVLLSLAALVILIPLFVVVAILIKWDSPGPVLFTHRRERQGGRSFPCLKFRTMTVGAHGQQRGLYKQNMLDGPQFKLANDSRITGIGRYLRWTNIDELPQLINVLVGHMSLVGPRPSPFRENQICVPWRRARLSVRPGITGLWQICRSTRSSGDFQQWIFYDMLYVKNLSIWVDLRIIIATILTLGGWWSTPLPLVLPANQYDQRGF